MFDHDVLVSSNPHNLRLLKRMGLAFGRDYQSVKGAVAAGRPHQLLLKFKDRDKAIMFKLQAIA